MHTAERHPLEVADPREGADVDRVALRLLRDGLALDGAVRIGIALTRGAGRELWFTASDRDNASVAGVDWCTIDGMADLPLTQAVRTGRPIHLPDVAALYRRYPGMADRQVDLGTRALTAYPLVDGGTVHGGVLLSFDRPQAFDAEQRAALESLARRTAVALTEVHARSRVVALAGHGRGPAVLASPAGVELGQHHGLADGGSSGGNGETGWVEAVVLPDGALLLAAGRGPDVDPISADTARRGLREAVASGSTDPATVLHRLGRPAAVAVLDPTRRRLCVAASGRSAVAVAGPQGTRLLATSRQPLEVHLGPGSVVVLLSSPATHLLEPALGRLDGGDPLHLALRLGRVLPDLTGDATPSVLVARVADGGTHRVCVDLPDDATAPRLARRAVASHLDCWGAADLIEAAQACVSELCTNALMHSATGARLTLSVDARRAVVLVQNGGVGRVRRVDPDDDGVGGRGLLLVDALSTDWGWRTGAEGTTVWFELARESATTGRAPD